MQAGYLAVNGLQVYYEAFGEPQAGTVPLLLIPGAFLGTDSMRQWVEVFAPGRPVVVFDQQGHGRTKDIDRSMSYDQFADDAAEVLKQLGIERADVMGYSQGGGVALQLALRHPGSVNKLVIMSATYRRDGWYASALEGIGQMTPELFANTPIGEAFRKHTDDPQAFAAYIEKMRVLNSEDQEIGDDEMRAIEAKAMVIAGDADGVTPEHAVAMFKLLGGGDERAAASGMLPEVPKARLLILPATAHISISHAVPALAPLISAFLEDRPPAMPSLW